MIQDSDIIITDTGLRAVYERATSGTFEGYVYQRSGDYYMGHNDTGVFRPMTGSQGYVPINGVNYTFNYMTYTYYPSSTANRFMSDISLPAGSTFTMTVNGLTTGVMHPMMHYPFADDRAATRRVIDYLMTQLGKWVTFRITVIP